MSNGKTEDIKVLVESTECPGCHHSHKAYVWQQEGDTIQWITCRNCGHEEEFVPEKIVITYHLEGDDFSHPLSIEKDRFEETIEKMYDEGMVDYEIESGSVL